MYAFPDTLIERRPSGAPASAMAYTGGDDGDAIMRYCVHCPAESRTRVHAANLCSAMSCPDERQSSVLGHFQDGIAENMLRLRDIDPDDIYQFVKSAAEYQSAIAEQINAIWRNS